MKKKMLAIILTLTLALGLLGCGGDGPDAHESAPGRMVRQIEVAIHPADDSFQRLYVTQENMNALLVLLRSMVTDKAPEREPDLNGGQSYYTATVTFTNGEQSVYYLLGHTYLRLGSDPWCIIDPELSLQFSDFIRNHPSDDGSDPAESSTETTAPAPAE